MTHPLPVISVTGRAQAEQENDRGAKMSASQEVLLVIDMQVSAGVAQHTIAATAAPLHTAARRRHPAPPPPASTDHCRAIGALQNDFCLPGAVLCVKGAMGCVPKVIEAVQLARSRGVPVIWVIREHDPAGTDVERFRQPMFQQGKPSTVAGTPGEVGPALQPTNGGLFSCLALLQRPKRHRCCRLHAPALPAAAAGTRPGLPAHPTTCAPPAGCELVAGLEVAPGERVLVKKRFSAFCATNLDLVLR